jgi:hypothetical protein
MSTLSYSLISVGLPRRTVTGWISAVILLSVNVFAIRHSITALSNPPLKNMPTFFALVLIDTVP